MSIHLLALLFPLGLLAQTSDCNCCTPAHRQFDFWVGQWQVYTGDTLAGTNDIVLLQDSCLLREQWTSARSGYTGTSYNFYDARSGQWHQTWVDNQGGSLRLRGEFRGGMMRLQSEPFTTPDGQTRRHRLTWTPQNDGYVRQHWQLLDEQDQAVQTIFDGLYRRVAVD